MKRLGWLCCMLLVACQPQEADYQPVLGRRSPVARTELVVGIHPLHNPRRLLERYGPIIAYINRSMPEVQLRLEASRNYDEYDRKLYSRRFDFAMPNPYETVLSLKNGYRVFGKIQGDGIFRGIILVRKDGGIRQPTDLKGKKVAYPAPSALAATMMPQYFLQTHGVDVQHDITNLYVGSQESSILNVLRGFTAAGATWPVPWQAFQQEHPDQAAQLLLKWQTDTLPGVGWVVRDDVAPALAQKFAAALFSLQHSEEGRRLLAALPLAGFESASDKTYLPVQEFLAQFARTVRPIEQ